MSLFVTLSTPNPPRTEPLSETTFPLAGDGMATTVSATNTNFNFKYIERQLHIVIKYVCDDCRELVSRKDLEEHQERHSKEQQPPVCNTCEKLLTFDNFAQLSFQHYNKQRNVVMQRINYCNQCIQPIISFMNKQISESLGIDNICDQCGKPWKKSKNFEGLCKCHKLAYSERKSLT